MQSPTREATLAQWIAQEQAMRARLAEPGSLSMAEVSALSPTEFFEDVDGRLYATGSTTCMILEGRG